MTSKTALVTGGNRGLGRATALALAGDGVDVIITYRGNEDEAAKVVAEIEEAGRKGRALRLDTGAVATFDGFVGQVVATLAEWGRERLDFLVNNAGHAAVTPLGETSVETVDLLYAVHFKGPFFLTQALAPTLADGGAIVNLSSGLARFTGPGWSVYGAFKAAVDQLTKYWATELGPRGIRVNTVAPGPIATDFGGGAMRDNEQARDHMSGRAALGRIGEPGDIGPLIATMLSDRTAWITGQRIEASGGTNL